MNDSLPTADASAPARATGDEELLNSALLASDDLLAASLRDDQRRRRMRTFLLAVGGLAMALVITAFLAGWFTVGGAVTAADRQEATTLAEEGWKLWQQQNFGEAEKKFSVAVKLDPKAEHAWNGLGWSRFNQGQRKEALKAFHKCIELSPKHPAALNGLGQVYYFEGDLQQAETYLKKAAPQASAAWYGLAKLYLLKGEYKKALPYARKIVAATPDDDWAKQMLEAAKNGDLPEDLKALIAPPDWDETSSKNAEDEAPASGKRKLSQEDREQSQDLTAEGWGLWQQRNFAEAEIQFEEAVELNPRNENALNGLGWSRFNQGRRTEAIEAFEKCVALSPKHPAALNGLGQAYFFSGDLKQAEKYLRKAAPNAPASWFTLAKVYLLTGEFKKALPYARKAAAEAPEDETMAKLVEAAQAGKLDEELKAAISPPEFAERDGKPAEE